MIGDLLFGMFIASFVAPIAGWRASTRLASAGYDEASAGVQRATWTAAIAALLSAASFVVPASAYVRVLASGMLLWANLRAIRALADGEALERPRRLYGLMCATPMVIVIPVSVVLLQIMGTPAAGTDGAGSMTLALATLYGARQAAGMTGVVVGLGGLLLAAFAGKTLLEQQGETKATEP